MQYIIQACCGQAIDVAAGQSITITDLEGQQVVDFFAEVQGNHNEFVSPGVTLDVNESLRLKTGDRIYSNLYRPMFLILHDDVCEHDLLHPCCRREMYDFFYQNGSGYFRKSDCASRPFRRNENRVLCRSGRKACLSR